MFRAPCNSGGGEVGGWGWGWLGSVPHTCAHACTCTYVHACTHTCGKHDNFMQMSAPIGGIPGNSLWCHMHVCVHVHPCICVHVHVCGGHPLTTPPPTSTPPPTPPGGTPGISQNSITLELIKIFQFSLKIWNLWRPPHPWVGVLLVDGWVGGWVGWLMGRVRSKH